MLRNLPEKYSAVGCARFCYLQNSPTGNISNQQEVRHTTPAIAMSQNKTKKDIAKIISEDTGITQQQSKLLIQKTFDTIIDILKETGRLELRNFGVFKCKMRKARTGRNPKTDEPVDIPEKLVVTFKPGKKMEMSVRGAAGISDASGNSHTEDSQTNSK